jgi:two-component system cell cycle response regulator
MRVLLADDDRMSRRLLEHALTGWGYQVMVVGDGEQAWEALTEENAPKLAIIDWMMPAMDGVTLCRKLRGRHGAPYTYVVVLTGRNRTDDLVEALEAGADDYVAKPHNNAELKARLRTGRRVLELEEALRLSATRDALTGLWNRGAILHFLDGELDRARRQGAQVAVLAGDVDRFKSINDNYGHAAGDAVLREISARMSAGVRSYDKVGRLGGEEYLVVLPNINAAESMVVAERIRAAIAARPIETPYAPVQSTISIGVALSDPLGRIRGDQLMRSADEALYRAKHGGRDRVELAPPQP